MTLMLKYFTTNVVIGLVIYVLIAGQELVFLKWEIVNKTLILFCRVDRLTFSIDFINPNGTVVGFCNPPVNEPDCSSPKGSILQNLEINATTLTIKIIDKGTILGKWTCSHGSYIDTAVISYEPCIDICQTDTNQNAAIIVIVVLIFVMVVVSICILFWRRQNIHQTKKCKDLENLQETMNRRPEQTDEAAGDSLVSDIEEPEPSDDAAGERQHLLPSIKDNESKTVKSSESGVELIPSRPNEGGEVNRAFSEICHTCGSLSTCAVCASCDNIYCGVCCVTHIKYYKEHMICKMEHIFMSQNEVICKICSLEPATNVCTGCKKVLCKDCTEQHKHEGSRNELITLRSKTNQCDSGEIEPLRKRTLLVSQKKPEPPVNIFGIVFLSDGRIVVVDNKNSQLLVFNDKCVDFQIKLDNEPRGIAKMTANKIAVSFYYVYEIHIFDVGQKPNNAMQVISLKTLDVGKLKPYYICYSNNHFAVEAGEGDEGRILIIHEDGTFKKSIKVENHLAHFSGNTIRMDFEMEDINTGKIFICAMSRKVVICCDMDGKVLWTEGLPDPRGIVAIPGKTKSGKNLIVASKTCSAVFRLDGKTAEVLLAKGDIMNPRYIAYHADKQLLCIQVTKDPENNPGDHQLLFYRYKDVINDTKSNTIEQSTQVNTESKNASS